MLLTESPEDSAAAFTALLRSEDASVPAAVSIGQVLMRAAPVRLEVQVPELTGPLWPTGFEGRRDGASFWYDLIVHLVTRH